MKKLEQFAVEDPVRFYWPGEKRIVDGVVTRPYRGDRYRYLIAVVNGDEVLVDEDDIREPPPDEETNAEDETVPLEPRQIAKYDADDTGDGED